MRKQNSIAAFCSFLLIFLFGISTTNAQTLPTEMYLSPDGRMLLTGGQQSQGLYDPTVIRDVELTFSQSNYWQQLLQNYQSQTNIAADMTVDGVSYPNVGVRFKGQTSYFMNQNSDKNSFNISLDFTDPNQEIMGYETLNFQNCFQDPSFLREFVYQHEIRKYIPAAKSSYIRLKLNGQDWGIYPHVQQLNGDFLEEWFFSNDGTRWRADEPAGTGGPGGGGPGGGGPGGGGGPQWGDGTAALNYLGSDTALYQPHYTLKTTKKSNPWEDLVKVTDVLENTPIATLEDSLKNYMDIDRTLWFLASEILFTDDDGYVYKGKMDYFLYWDEVTGQMVPLEYDGNSVMDPGKVNWSPFHNETNANYPLLNRLLAVPSVRQRYLAHVRVMMEESIDTANINPFIRQTASFIDAEVQSDPKKIYSYNAFQNEVTELQDFFNDRYNSLSNNTEVNVASPDISNVSYATNGQQWVKPMSNENTVINATITSTNGIAGVTLYYADALMGNFEEVTMLDDGMSNDGAANDGVYGASIPGFAAGTDVRFYVEAKAADAVGTVSYMPKGAEHDVYYYNVLAGASSNTDIVINEVMASNDATASDEAGEFDDWIELYNLSTSMVDMSGWYLTDKTDNLTKFQLPNGTSIDGHDFLIIWADEDGSQGANHANFKLSSSGETVMLLDSFVLVVDSMGFGQQTTDMGYARVPNGTGNFVIQAPTFSYDNDNVSTNPIERANEFNLFPNPTRGLFNVIIEDASKNDNTFRVFDTYGRMMTEILVNNDTQFQVDASSWSAGMYVMKYGDTVKKLLILK